MTMTDKYLQNIMISSEKLQEEKRYWISKLADRPVLSGFPIDLHGSESGYNKSSVHIKLPNNVSDKIISIANNSDYGIFIILLSGIIFLIHKYSGDEDILVGSPIIRQENKPFDHNNLLIIRNHINKGITFKELVLHVKQSTDEANENGHFPFDKIMELLDCSTTDRNAPYVKTLVYMDNMHYQGNINGIKMDIAFRFTRDDGSIECTIEYNHEIYKSHTVEYIGIHLIDTLKAVLMHPGDKLTDIDILAEDEKQQVLLDFNKVYEGYENTKPIHYSFAEQVKKTPGNKAVVYNDAWITYDELSKKADKLAYLLKSKGIKPNCIVGIMMDRSIQFVICILGILKSGGAFLPIDPGYPKERIKQILMDSKVKVLITEDRALDAVDFDGEVINIDQVDSLEARQLDVKVESSISDLLYVIYTSGTTGTPKGVMLEHKNLANLIEFKYRYTNIDFSGRVLQFANSSFDVCYQEMFSTLLKGGELHIIDNDKKRDVSNLFEFIRDHSVDIVFFPTAFFKYIMGDEKTIHDIPNSVKHIVVAGEQLTVSRKFRQYMLNNHLFLHNHYGPSETHVVTAITMSGENSYDIPPIGKPISNVKALIFGADNCLQGICMPGELHISGENVGRGYFDRSSLTNERFILCPYFCGERMYKTGDYAKWLPDGNIEFLGRLDHQVKIRGFRVELQEIEECMRLHSDLKDVVVLVKDDPQGNKMMIAYYTAERPLSVSEIRDFLLKKIPEYMIPSGYIQLEKMPLNQNGKVDRKALFNLSHILPDNPSCSLPENETENEICQIWREVLGIERIGITDNFFELGGHSIKAAGIASRIYKQFGIHTKVSDVFRLPTVQQFSEFINETNKSLYRSIEAVEYKAYYPVSSAQKRLYILWQIERDSTAYNLPNATIIEGNLDINQLEHAFKSLVQRHESLRTTFEFKANEPVQVIHNNTDFSIQFYEATEGELNDVIEGFLKPFDLERLFLFRVNLIKYEEHKFLLFTDMHHIIADGISLDILMKEFYDLYRNKTLEPLKLQYKDYANWQRKWLEGEPAKLKEKYWIDKFNAGVPTLELQTDYPRLPVQSYDGRDFTFSIDNTTVKRMANLAVETNTTLFALLFAAFNILLSQYTGQENIVIGTPLTGRSHPDIDMMIGMFVNTAPVVSSPLDDKTFKQFLFETRENILGAFENQDYPFERLIEKIPVQRDLGRNPLFDIMFTFDDLTGKDEEIKGLSFKKFYIESKISKFDISLHVKREEDTLEFCLQYSNKLFKRDTIERMSYYFLNIINQVIDNSEIKLSDIDILPDEEKNSLIYGFNDTAVNYPREKTIMELFEEQVEKRPDSIALILGSKIMNYSELNGRSNQLARLLRSKGIKSNSIVGIIAKRSFEMIIGIFGILKAGAAYLPIDPRYPIDRINYMIQDSGIDLLLSQQPIDPILAFNGDVIIISDERIYNGDQCNLEKVNAPSDLAYVIYTSGSTGTPKGAMVEHYSLINRILWMQRAYPIDVGDVLLQKTTYTFDVSVWELVWWSTQGARLCILEADGEGNPELIVNAIEKNNVSVLHFVPSMLNVFLEYIGTFHKAASLTSLKHVFASGEAISVKQVEMFNVLLYQKNKTLLHNLYGPTEATIDVTYFNCLDYFLSGKNYGTIPIGKPIDNIRLYILDRKMKLRPLGLQGELVIAGDGVGRGYLNKPELTNIRFVKDILKPNERMYRTGDIARWLPDGNIEYIGRVDNQVKIRGFRIELGEIETQLLKHPYVKEAIVETKERRNSGQFLCAYIVLYENKSIPDIREFLSKSLPEYMIPAYFITLQKVPMTLNDKVDRKALPIPEDNCLRPDGEVPLPNTNTERVITTVWKELLGLEYVNIYSNFFELGGNSLNVIQANNRINELLGVNIPVVDMFRYTTINSLAKYIDSATLQPRNSSFENKKSLDAGKNRIKQRMQRHGGDIHEQ